MTTLRVGSATDVGRIRTNNQDDLLVTDTLFAVADGMGGHQGGEVASSLAVSTLRDQVSHPTSESLLAGARAANQVIYDAASADPDLHGMGTTLCAVALVDDDTSDDDSEHEPDPVLAVINVGDSRVYLFRDGNLTQLTRDHSLVEDLRQEGRLSEEELAVHPHRNIITRALGIAPDVEIDEFTVIPRRGDRLVLCSDGLFNEVSADRMAATLRRLEDPDEVARELVRQANDSGGRDNVTAVGVDVVDHDGRAEGSGGAPGARSRGTGRPDLAGFSTAEGLDAESAATSSHDAARGTDAPDADRRRRRHADREARHADTRPRRFTWRVAAFLVLVVAVLASACGIVYWYARGTYYVGYDSQGQVTVYRGKAKGFLWFHPTAVDHTGISGGQVPVQFGDALSAGKEWSDRAAADRYVANIRSVICRDIAARASSPTTGTIASSSAPTTTLPPECAAPTTPTPTTTVPTTAPPTAPAPAPAPPSTP